MRNQILNKVNEYYSNKIEEYGPTSQGVDWNGKESHFLRFEQLCKVLPKSSRFSLLDYGCGYGSLLEFLAEKKIKSDYTGYDISLEMITQAKKIFPKHHFIPNLESSLYDYTIANGIFNVKLDCEEKKWGKYIHKTLHEINELSKKGFSFNLLTSYSDIELMKEYLYYANPLELFDYCKKNFSRNISLLHDYDLYEFTIIVRK